MSLGFRSIRALDGIRGLAIILVMLVHFAIVIPDDNIAIRSMKVMFSFGWVGVDLFFALSGFLITGILLDTRKVNNYFSAFYARRVLRIFPLYYSVLIVILAASAALRHRPHDLPLVADQKLYFLYLTNWLVLWKGQWGPNILGHFWSLAVEEQFYLIWPLCVWLLNSKRLAKVTVGASVIALLVRIFWVAHTGISPAIAIATVTRMDTLLCGALAAILFRQAQTLRASNKTHLSPERWRRRPLNLLEGEMQSDLQLPWSAERVDTCSYSHTVNIVTRRSRSVDLSRSPGQQSVQRSAR